MRKKVMYIAIAAVLLLAIFIISRAFGNEKQAVELNTAKIVRGEINDIITATGTLEALMTVQVGTQVSGVIEKIYVDFNSQVKKGQLLAQLDKTPLQANLEQSQATVDNAQAEFDYQKANYDRYKILADKNLIADTEFDLVVYNYQKALATLKNAKSVYDKNKINLDYATIYSPIDGIILDRAVDEGQTVAASFSTPTLFTIANDLTQMQVEANIDEADIGKLKVLQRVEFTVDAYPDIKFGGEVSQIRLQPVESSNVVTYTVIINAPNPEKKLMPGMTANASFYVTEKKNILLLPANAVSFDADPQIFESYQQNHPEIKIMQLPSEIAAPSENTKLIWVKKGNEILPVKVELGETDEINYEIILGVNEGDEVIVGTDSPVLKNNVKESDTKSPFMPSPPGSNRKN